MVETVADGGGELGDGDDGQGLTSQRNGNERNIETIRVYVSCISSWCNGRGRRDSKSGRASESRGEVAEGGCLGQARTGACIAASPPRSALLISV